MSERKNILHFAKVVRSKNSGPFELTLDIIFHNKRYFDRIKAMDVFSKKKMAALYKTRERDILKIVWFEPANAVKVTLKRWMPSGGAGESDIYGAQQHAPLLGLRI